MSKSRRIMGILIVLVLLMSVLTAGIIQVSAFTGHEQITDVQRLFSEANTFDCTKVDRETHPDRYEVEYNMTSRNGRRVMDKPQITVLTHGWRMGAFSWSNDYNKENAEQYKNINPTFAFDKDSLIERINDEVGGANIYWAKMAGDESFDLIEISSEKQKESSEYSEDKEFIKDKVTDISKHIIVVFQAENESKSHNNVYYRFNYMLSNIVNDVKILNGGILPRLNLVAHSRGGITNMQYALDHPDLVASLISMGTPYFGSTTATVAGAALFGSDDGLEDIINPELYYGYSNRWNTNYERLYKI